MKKLLLTGLLVSIAAWGFSQTTQDVVQDIWVTFGFEAGNYFENFKSNGKSYSQHTISPGVSINSYSFVQDGIGWFMRTSYLFPAYLADKEIGGEQEDIRGDFSSMLQMAVLGGPAVKFSIGDSADLYFGLGLGFMYSDGYLSDDAKQREGINSGTKVSLTTISTNLGADLGFKVDLTNRVFINIGASATWEFLVNKEMIMDFEVSGVKTSISEPMTVTTAFNIRPYICIGLQSYSISQIETGPGRAPRD